MKTRWVWKIVTLFVLAGVLWPSHVSAQDDPHEKNRILLAGVNIVNISWSPDSHNLVFQVESYDNEADRPIYGPYTPGTDYWHSYSVETGQILRGEIWPLQPHLTPQQFQDFEIYHNGNDQSFVYISPNGRYLIYSGQVPANAGYGLPLGIADLDTGTHRLLDESEDVERNDIPGYIEAYKIQWSENSTAFTLDSWFGRGIYHISQLDNLDTLVVRWLNPAEGLPLGDSTFRPGAIFDLSIDGDRILTWAGDLVIWDVTTTTGTSISVEGIVAGAIFTPDEQAILFVDEEGLKRHDIAENQTTLLNPEISSTWADGGAYFSPDGKYVAINADDLDALYLFEVIEADDIPDDDSE